MPKSTQPQRRSYNSGWPLVVISDQFPDDRRERIAALAIRHALPSVYPRREYAVAGGLISS